MQGGQPIGERSAGHAWNRHDAIDGRMAADERGKRLLDQPGDAQLRIGSAERAGRGKRMNDVTD